MKFFKKTIIMMSVGALATVGAMCLMNCDSKPVNDLKEKECNMIKKFKKKFM